MGEFLKLLSMLKCEFYLFVIVLIFYLKVTPLDVLIQDKICVLQYNMSSEFCYGLSSIDENDANYHIKSEILSAVVTFKSYQNLIYYIPGTIWSLFLGSWCDRYVSAKKWIMLIGAITTAIENLMNAINSFYFSLNINWILVSFVPYTLSGSMAISTCYTYVAASSPDKYKAIRMTIIEILIMLANPASTMLSGQLIDKSPMGGVGQVHNYGILFSICSALGFIVFFWCVFMIDEQHDKVMFEKKFLVQPIVSADYDTRRHPLRLLFDLNNVKQMIMTFVKSRPYNMRSQILLVCLALFNYMFLAYAQLAFQFQFAERVYNWDAETYSTFTSIGYVVNGVAAIVLGPILINKLKLNDMIISIIGFIGVYNLMLFRGVILSPFGFYLSIATSFTYTLCSVGFKSHLAKVVDQNEMGKVFTIIMVLDSLAPILASSLIAMLFEATIDSMPGTCFLLLAFLSLTTILMAMAIDFIYLKNQKFKQNEHKIPIDD